MTPGPAVVVVLLAASLLLGACAGGTPDGGQPAGEPADTPTTRPAPPPSATPTPATPTPATPTPGAPPPEDLVVPPTPSGRGSVLTGTIEAGTERGCLLLAASGVLHQLVGAVQGLEPGQRVTVQGRPDPSLVTTCQQGTPFVVLSAAPA